MSLNIILHVIVFLEFVFLEYVLKKMAYSVIAGQEFGFLVGVLYAVLPSILAAAVSAIVFSFFMVRSRAIFKASLMLSFFLVWAAYWVLLNYFYLMNFYWSSFFVFLITCLLSFFLLWLGAGMTKKIFSLTES